MRTIIRLMRQRRELGKDTHVQLKGRRMDWARVEKYLRRRKLSVDEFLAETPRVMSSSDIRCYTPPRPGSPSAYDESGEWQVVAMEDDFKGLLPSSNDPLSLTRPPDARLEHQPFLDSSPVMIHAPHIYDLCESSPEDERFPRSRPGSSDGILSPMQKAVKYSESPGKQSYRLAQGVESMAIQVLTPESSLPSHGDFVEVAQLMSPSPVLSKSEDPETLVGQAFEAFVQPSHSKCLEYLNPSAFEPGGNLKASNCVDLPARWVSLCFYTCIFHGQQQHEQATASREMAAQVFDQMIRCQNDQALTGLNLVLSILVAHGHKDLGANFLSDATAVSSNCLGPSHQVTLTCRWMAAAATGKPDSCGYGSEELRQIHAYFQVVWGRSHPHTLLSLYNLAWTLTLENKNKEAETRLRELYDTSSVVFPRPHMQTVTALTTLSRVYSKLGKHDQAVQAMEEAIDRSKDLLGAEHPKCLESRRRLAGLYEKVGRHEMVEPIYWAVLQGRVKMLGPKHTYTRGSLKDLMELLQKQGQGEKANQIQSSVLALENGANDFYELMKAY